jgi:hypothetical protein
VAGNTSFVQLVGRLRAGDPATAAELVRWYEPAVRAAVRSRMADTRLRRLFDSHTVLGQYQPTRQRNLVNLLVGMARNQFITQARLSRRAGRQGNGVAYAGRRWCGR